MIRQETNHAPKIIKRFGPIHWALVGVIVTMPLFQFSLFSVGGRGLLRIDWLGIFVFLGVFALWSTQVRPGIWSLHRFSKPALVFGYVSLLTMVNLFDASPKRLEDFFTVSTQLVLNIILFVVIAGLGMDADTVLDLIRAWVVVACVMSSYAIYQVIARIYHLPFAWVVWTNPSISGQSQMFSVSRMAQRGYFIRPAALLGEPSYLAAYVLPALFLMLMARVYLSSRESSLLGSPVRDMAALLTLAIGFVFAASVGPAIAALCTLIIAAATGILGVRAMLRGAIAVAIASGLLQAVSVFLDIYIGGTLIARLLLIFGIGGANPLEDASFALRFEGTRTAFNVFLQHPITGWGLGYIGYLVGSGTLPSEAMSSPPWTTLLAEAGLLGLVTLLALVIPILSRLHAQLRREDLQGGDLVLVRGMYIVLWSELFLAFILHPWNTQPQRWIVLALAVVVARNVSELGPKPSGHSTLSRQPAVDT